MTKTLVLTLTALVSIMLLSGCTKHPKYVGPAPKKSYDTDKVQDGELISITAQYVQGHGMLPGNNGIESVYYTFQLAAEDTLNNNKKYFSIYRPIAISDFEGRGLKSEQDFIDRCIDDAAPTVTAIAIQGQMISGYCGTTQRTTSNLEIVQFLEKPTNFTSFDAQKVLNLVKDNGYYVDQDDQRMVGSVHNFKTSYSSAYGYQLWFDTRRSDLREAD